MGGKDPDAKTRVFDKTVIKSLAQCSFAQNGETASVDVKDGKIVRIRPHHHTERYTEEELGQWELTKDGHTYKKPSKGLLAPFMIAYKKRVYSPNRILYPLKRVDWDPKGERNPQNRGKSKYVRISWDEATTLIADEIGRIQRNTVHWGSLRTATVMGRPRAFTDRTACRWISCVSWAAIPRPSAMRIAGRAGIGAPSMSGGMATMAWSSRPTTC